MNQKFKISSYRGNLIGFILQRIRGFLGTLIFLVLAVIYVIDIVRNGVDNDVFFALIIIVCLLGLIGFIILIDYYPLSYTLTLTDDGRIIETQILNHPREIYINDINSAKWGYMGAAPHWGLDMLIRKFRGQVTNQLAKTPDWIGFSDRFSYGVELINPKYTNFPKYPISTDFITELKKLRPDLVIENLPDERIPEVQRRRSFATSFILYGLGGFVILMDIVLGFYLWFVFLLFGGGLIFAGWYTSKQK